MILIILHVLLYVRRGKKGFLITQTKLGISKICIIKKERILATKNLVSVNGQLSRRKEEDCNYNYKEGFESIRSAQSFDEMRETQAYEQCTSAASAIYESEMHTDDGSQIITLTYILCAALEWRMRD